MNEKVHEFRTKSVSRVSHSHQSAAQSLFKLLISFAINRLQINLGHVRYLEDQRWEQRVHPRKELEGTFTTFDSDLDSGITESREGGGGGG